LHIKLKQLLWIFLLDTYVILISFAFLKVLELMFKSFWAKKLVLFKIIDLTFTLPVLLAYAFLLTFDLSECLFVTKSGNKKDGQ
jgi:hypothetical protein